MYDLLCHLPTIFPQPIYICVLDICAFLCDCHRGHLCVFIAYFGTFCIILSLISGSSKFLIAIYMKTNFTFDVFKLTASRLREVLALRGESVQFTEMDRHRGNEDRLHRRTEGARG